MEGRGFKVRKYEWKEGVPSNVMNKTILEWERHNASGINLLEGVHALGEHEEAEDERGQSDLRT